MLLQVIEAVVKHLEAFAKNGEVERYVADATVFMEMAGYIVIAWQWLKQAEIAAQKIASKDFSTQTATFYESKIYTMEFFFQYELPHSLACEKIILNDRQLTHIRNHAMFA